MFRLYVDEVGHDGLTHLENDKQRYLSLTGVAIQIAHARDLLTPSMNWIKANVFNHDIDAPLIFHRKDIMGYKGAFGILKTDKDKKELFDQSITRLFKSTEYSVITAFIDKHWMVRQIHWIKTHPYHYLMEILVEKYVQFLERQHDIGDIMPESRQSKDKLLQDTYKKVRSQGTDYVTPEQLESALRGAKLKFRAKSDNIAGLQLCDLIAHPSHIYTRSLMGHPVQLGPFATLVTDILVESKYDRSPWSGKIIGYGIKHLPQ